MKTPWLRGDHAGAPSVNQLAFELWFWLLQNLFPWDPPLHPLQPMSLQGSPQPNSLLSSTAWHWCVPRVWRTHRPPASRVHGKRQATQLWLSPDLSLGTTAQPPETTCLVFLSLLVLSQDLTEPRLALNSMSLRLASDSYLSFLHLPGTTITDIRHHLLESLV